MKFLWSILILLFVGGNAFAQVNFWHVSASAEKTISDVGYQNMQSAWFVTGNDTVYTYRFVGGKNVARKTPWDADTTWTTSDSVYHKYESAFGERGRFVAYYKGRAKRQTMHRDGKLENADHWQHDSLGREIYHRQWTPRKTNTTIKHPNGMVEWLIEDPENNATTLRKQHCDTNRVWSFSGTDTTTHRYHWKNYAEIKHYQPFYLSKEWWDGIRRTKVFETDDFTDSSIVAWKDDIEEIWQYRQVVPSQELSLYEYSKTDGLKTKKSRYVFSPESDTARYTIEKYERLKNGQNRQVQMLRLNKDSARYRQIDFYWDENGGIDYYKITNRKGKTRIVKQIMDIAFNANIEDENIEYIDDDSPPEPKLFFEVLPNDYETVMVGDRSLKQQILQKLFVNTDRCDGPLQDTWLEIILFEIDENGQVNHVQCSSNTRLNAQQIKQDLNSAKVEVPKGLKTTFYYLDAKGKKHKKPMDFVLLPIPLLLSY